MTESLIIYATCPKCSNKWWPNGKFQATRVPFTEILTCPKCGYTDTYTWLDSETQTKLTQKAFGVNSEQELTQSRLIASISEVNQKIQLLQKEVDLERSKRELFEERLRQMDEWKNKREKDFEEIERLANELKEEEQYREDNK